MHELHSRAQQITKIQYKKNEYKAAIESIYPETSDTETFN